MATNMTIICPQLPSVQINVAEGDNGPRRKGRLDVEELDASGVDGRRYRERRRVHAEINVRVWIGCATNVAANAMADTLEKVSGNVCGVYWTKGAESITYGAALVEITGECKSCFAPLIDADSNSPAYVVADLRIVPLKDAT